MRNYYLLAIQRYFSTPVPYFMIISVPLMFYGYWNDDLCFWLGMGITVLAIAINHLMMSTLTRTFGMYATVKEVNYVSSIVSGDCKVFSKQECEKMLLMFANLSDNDKYSIEDYIRHINHQLEDKAKNGNAEANYWLGVYYRKLCKEDDHNAVARQFIEKSAELGWEEAKRLLKKAKTWS